MYSSRIVLNRRQIDAINFRNFQRSEADLIDLYDYDIEEGVPQDQLEKLFQLDKLDQKPLYNKDGILHGDDFYDDLKTKITDSQLIANKQERCAVAIDNALIRMYPTMMGGYRADEVSEIDRFAVSIVKLGEPALIYCETVDHIWCFVRTTQVCGWVLRKTLTLEPDMERWRQYGANQEQVIVADGRRTITYINHSGLQREQMLLMGTRLSLYDATYKNFLLGLPIKDKHGNLAILQLMMARDGSLIPDLMPLSSQNIVSQAKKLLCEPYGWGGSNFDWDCTSLIADVYSVFGLRFPRNSQQQKQMVGVVPCPTDREQKYQFIRSLMPGSVLYCSDHAMLYLGEQNRQLCMLHSSYAIGLPAKDRLIPYKIRRVVEGSLSQYRATGETFLDAVTSVWAPDRQKPFLHDQ